MSEVVASAKKAVSTVDLALSALGILKTLGIVFGMVLLDFARRKEKLAENKNAVSETQLNVKAEQEKIKHEASKKTSSDIIDSFLSRK